MKDSLCQCNTQFSEHSLTHHMKQEAVSYPTNQFSAQCDIYDMKISPCPFQPSEFRSGDSESSDPYPHTHNDSMSESNWGQEDSSMLLQIEPSKLLGEDAAQMIKNNNQQPFRKETLKGYKLGKIIGRGGFSQVLVGTHKLSGRKIAIKVIEKSKLMSVQDHNRVQWEVAALQLLQHPNVLRLLEVVDLPHQLYMVTDYIPDGSLLHLLTNQGPLKEHVVAKYIAQITLALIYCHQHGVLHRDIKLENLLIDKQTDQIKIVDFGLSVSWQPGRELNSCCGTASYAAPEIHARKRYGAKVDVWSLGVVMYALLTGKLPFNDPDKSQKIIQGDFEEPKNISQCCLNLLRKMLHTDPQQRISLQSVLEHPWIAPLLMNKGVLNEEEVFKYDLIRDPEHGCAYPLPMILELQKRYGFDGSEVSQDLTDKKCSGGSAAYFLLLHNLWDMQRRLGQDTGLYRAGYKLSCGSFCVAPIGHVGRDDSARFVHFDN
eukprot:TRINITY_DN3864_c0_g1_i8.p1 TRINITY_DN3864_c0_g1~~TRINITY_DN3864_c0_g1_i8.p1  ORF type:complete len:487 (+),score=87.31 TRINITY_DN3864_c0_g1_i8:147-1607(+)